MSPIVMRTGEVGRTKTLLCFTNRENIVGRTTISVHLRHKKLDENEEHELAHLLILICFCIRRINEIFLGIYDLATLREIIMHFRFPSLGEASEDFVYCLYHFVVGSYDSEGKVFAPYFQIIEAAY